MSGTVDRREEDHVPQLHGRIDEKFAEWEIDGKLWEAECKEDDRVRLGPRLYRRGMNGQPKIIVRTKARYTRCVSVHSAENHPMPQGQWAWRTS